MSRGLSALLKSTLALPSRCGGLQMSRGNTILFSVGAGVLAGGFVFSHSATIDNQATLLLGMQSQQLTARCQESSYAENPDEEDEVFFVTLSSYMDLLPEIKKMWATGGPASLKWPNQIPTSEEISSLEIDLKLYLKGSLRNSRICQNLQFRIACYYLFRGQTVAEQRKGFLMVKKLTAAGHVDGMCLYALILSHGGVAGIEPNPHLAVKFWRRAADEEHMESMYELGVALFTGDGVVEDTVQAAKFFIKAADLGHSGAAYMLAECFLDGIGVTRIRSRALEYLVVSAEMGHRQAQGRLELLLGDPGSLTEEERIRWGLQQADIGASSARKVSLERRFTIGGGSSNPIIFFRRRTAVDESRQAGDDTGE